MRFHVFATDYDGTIAREGRVDDETIAALDAVRQSGRKLVLLTGRLLDDLVQIFPRLDLFEVVVAENGAVLHRPATRATRALAEAPPARFVSALRDRGVVPLATGQVIVSTWQPHEETVLDVIRTLGLELQVVFNKGAVMVLPSGVNKAFGLVAALDELGLSAHNAVGIGDAENDHAFLAACELSVAVANALPAVKERADVITRGDHGAGVQEIARSLVESDLVEQSRSLGRLAIPLGVGPDGVVVRVDPYGPPLLIAGTSGGGKSTAATAFLEQLADRGYQFCIVDPEGDYQDFEHATVVGDAKRAPPSDEALEILAKPAQNCALNLLGVSLADRPRFFDELLPRLHELRARTGRPHWIVVDEAHHLLPAKWRPSSLTLPQELHSLLLITVHPERISSELLAAVGTVLAVGAEPAATLARFADAAGVPAPRASRSLEAGQGLAWFRSAPGEALPFTVAPPRAERRRHVRKYASGELGPDKSFYFRGRDGRLNLRAQNLQLFLQLADGVDDDTWRFHLERGDYSRWFREAIKDDDLAAEAAAVERSDADPSDSRARIRAAIEERYTAPA